MAVTLKKFSEKWERRRFVASNDQGRYGEIGVFDDSSHRVGCEKVHAVRVGYGFFIHSSWYQARLKYFVSGMINELLASCGNDPLGALGNEGRGLSC